MMMNKYSAGILGTGFYVPEKIMTNEDLEKIVSMVNAVYITATDPEELARLETFIAHANGIVTQYRAVQRNRKRVKEE